MPLGPLNPLTMLAGLMSSAVPSSEVTGGFAGTSGLIPDAAHRHPRLTSTTVSTIDAGQTANVVFTRTFTRQPGISCTLIEAGTSQPVIFGVQDWLAADGVTLLGANPADGTVIGGVVIKAFRSTSIPQNLATLLLTAAQNIFSGSVVGARFTCIAVASSQP